MRINNAHRLNGAVNASPIKKTINISEIKPSLQKSSEKPLLYKLLTKANRLRKDGQNLQALNVLSEIEALAPQNRIMLKLKGGIYTDYRINDEKKALEYHEKFVTLNKDKINRRADQHIWMNLGWQYLSTGKYEKAIYLMEEVNKHFPNWASMEISARAYAYLGKMDAAVDQLIRSFNIKDGATSGLKKKAKDFYLKGNIPEARKLLKNAITLKLLTSEWESHFQAKEYAEALKILAESEKIDPTDSSMLDYSARCHVQLGNTDKAIEYYLRSLKSEWPDKSTYITLSHLYYSKGNIKEVLNCCKKEYRLSKDESGNSADKRYIIIAYKAALDKTVDSLFNGSNPPDKNTHLAKKILIYSRQLDKFEPNKAQTLYLIGWSYFLLGDETKARIYFNKTLSLDISYKDKIDGLRTYDLGND